MSLIAPETPCSVESHLRYINCKHSLLRWSLRVTQRDRTLTLLEYCRHGWTGRIVTPETLVSCRETFSYKGIINKFLSHSVSMNNVKEKDLGSVHRCWRISCKGWLTHLTTCFSHPVWLENEKWRYWIKKTLTATIGRTTSTVFELQVGAKKEKKSLRIGIDLIHVEMYGGDGKGTKSWDLKGLSDVVRNSTERGVSENKRGLSKYLLSGDFTFVSSHVSFDFFPPYTIPSVSRPYLLFSRFKTKTKIITDLFS